MLKYYTRSQVNILRQCCLYGYGYPNNKTKKLWLVNFIKICVCPVYFGLCYGYFLTYVFSIYIYYIKIVDILYRTEPQISAIN